MFIALIEMVHVFIFLQIPGNQGSGHHCNGRFRSEHGQLILGLYRLLRLRKNPVPSADRRRIPAFRFVLHDRVLYRLWSSNLQKVRPFVLRYNPAEIEAYWISGSSDLACSNFSKDPE